MAMMTSTDAWKLKSKPPMPSKKSWTTSNICSPNSSPTEIIMMPGVIIKSIMMMSSLRLRGQRKALPSMLKFLKASKLRSHP